MVGLIRLGYRLVITHGKLADLTVRAPVSGLVTSMDLTVGESRNLGDRLAEITPATGQFRFPYVTEGEYTLKVSNASDIIPGKGDQKPVRTYADASQSLIVKGETSGVNLQVKPLPVAATTAAQ